MNHIVKLDTFRDKLITISNFVPTLFGTYM